MSLTLPSALQAVSDLPQPHSLHRGHGLAHSLIWRFWASTGVRYIRYVVSRDLRRGRWDLFGTISEAPAWIIQYGNVWPSGRTSQLGCKLLEIMT